MYMYVLYIIVNLLYNIEVLFRKTCIHLFMNCIRTLYYNNHDNCLVIFLINAHTGSVTKKLSDISSIVKPLEVVLSGCSNGTCEVLLRHPLKPSQRHMLRKQ